MSYNSTYLVQRGIDKYVTDSFFNTGDKEMAIEFDNSLSVEDLIMNSIIFETTVILNRCSYDGEKIISPKMWFFFIIKDFEIEHRGVREDITNTILWSLETVLSDVDVWNKSGIIKALIEDGCIVFNGPYYSFEFLKGFKTKEEAMISIMEKGGTILPDEMLEPLRVTFRNFLG